MGKSKKSGIGWGVLVGYIVVYDFIAIKYNHETLSGGFWRHLERYPNRIMLTLAATMLYKHLVAPDVLPKTDPLKFFVDRWHRNKNGAT